MSPEGVLTAIPQKLGDRIRTPSIIACPPTFKALALPSALAGLAIPEPLHPTAGIHYALLTRVERVAVRADIHRDCIPRRRAGLELGAATGAMHPRRRVLGMYPRLHLKPPSVTGTTYSFYYACKGRRKGGRAFATAPQSRPNRERAAVRAGTRRWCESP